MQWFEDDGFWSELYPYMFPPDRFASAPAQVAQILALSGSRPGTVLDLCCGPGRHSLEFARLGYAVTGVDRSAFLLDRARERAAESGAAVEWVHEDMRVFSRPGAFDLACNIFTSFGYFDSEEDDLRVLRNVHESLRPGGVFVIETLGKERLARVFLHAQCSDYPDGAILVSRPRVLYDWTRVSNQWILIKDGRARTFQFEHSIYSGRELRDLLLAAGFGSVRLSGGLDGSEFSLDSQRLVAVARKE